MKIIITILLSIWSLFAYEPLVSSQWLNENITNKDIRIVEVSDGSSYSQGHIPGAAHTSIDKWRFNNGTFLSVRSVKEIEEEIRSLGIENGSHVVLYAPISVPKDFLKASYVYWAMKYHGIEKVSLLDGGMNAWKKEGYELVDIKPMINSTTFIAKIDSGAVADMTYVKTHIGKLPMIDARPGDKYLGISSTPTVERDGHIEGAMSYSWNYSVDDMYKVKSADKLEKLFRDGYGLKKDQEIIVYCTGGLETSFNYFVLSGILGYTNVRLYDASMKEWGNRSETPMSQYSYEVFGR